MNIPPLGSGGRTRRNAPHSSHTRSCSRSKMPRIIVTATCISGGSQAGRPDVSGCAPTP